MRGLQRAVWRSPAYVRLRRWAGRAGRPLRRAELGIIFRRDLGAPLPDAPTPVPIAVSEATGEEILGEVADLKQPPDPRVTEIFRERLERGFRCFVARVDGELIAYNWTQYEPGEDDGDLVDLRPDEVHCLDAYTVEPYRGLNIHAALLREMLLSNRLAGYRYAYSKVSALQRRSPKALRRLGWEVTGAVLRARGGRGRPVVRVWGSAHPWRRLR